MRRTVITCDCCGREYPPAKVCPMVVATVMQGGLGSGDNPLTYVDGAAGDLTSRRIDWADVCDPCQRAVSEAVFNAVDQIRHGAEAKVFPLPKQNLFPATA
jgi:hypothetical protein